MSTIFILLIETISLLLYFDVIHAEYSRNNEDLDYRKNKVYTEKTRTDNWIKYPLSKVDKLSPTEKELRRDKLWALKHNGIRDDENDHTTKYPEATEKMSTIQLAVRNRLALTLKRILEEMLVLVIDDINKTSKASRSLLEVTETNNEDTEDEQALNKIYEDALIKEETGFDMNGDWLEEIQNMRRIGNKVGINRISFPDNYQSSLRQPPDYIISKIKNQMPKYVYVN